MGTLENSSRDASSAVQREVDANCACSNSVSSNCAYLQPLPRMRQCGLRRHIQLHLRRRAQRIDQQRHRRIWPQLQVRQIFAICRGATGDAIQDLQAQVKSPNNKRIANDSSPMRTRRQLQARQIFAFG